MWSWVCANRMLHRIGVAKDSRSCYLIYILPGQSLISFKRVLESYAVVLHRLFAKCQSAQPHISLSYEGSDSEANR